MNFNLSLNEGQESTKMYPPGVQHSSQYYFVGGETFFFVGFLLVVAMEDTVL